MIISNSTFDTGDASATTITTSGGTGKTFDLLVENSTFENDSALNPAAEFLSSGNTTYNATIRGNTFDNSDAAPTTSDFTMTADWRSGAGTAEPGRRRRAEMNNAAGDGVYNLIEEAGADFDVFELTDTFANARNVGTVGAAVTGKHAESGRVRESASGTAGADHSVIGARSACVADDAIRGRPDRRATRSPWRVRGRHRRH